MARSFSVLLDILVQLLVQQLLVRLLLNLLDAGVSALPQVPWRELLVEAYGVLINQLLSNQFVLRLFRQEVLQDRVVKLMQRIVLQEHLRVERDLLLQK